MYSGICERSLDGRLHYIAFGYGSVHLLLYTCCGLQQKSLLGREYIKAIDRSNITTLALSILLDPSVDFAK